MIYPSSLQRRSDVDPGAQFKRFLDRLPTRARIVLLLLEQEYLQEFMFTVKYKFLFFGHFQANEMKLCRFFAEKNPKEAERLYS